MKNANRRINIIHKINCNVKIGVRSLFYSYNVHCTHSSIRWFIQSVSRCVQQQHCERKQNCLRNCFACMRISLTLSWHRMQKKNWKDIYYNVVVTAHCIGLKRNRSFDLILIFKKYFQVAFSILCSMQLSEHRIPSSVLFISFVFSILCHSLIIVYLIYGHTM